MASSKNLTAKEEKFISLVFQGNSQRKAYREAFPHTSKWMDKTVDETASRLYNSNKAKARWNEMNRKHQKKAIFTKDEMLRDLKRAFKMAMGMEATPAIVKKLVDGEYEEIANIQEVKVDFKAVASISHQIAKLEGWEIDKIEHSGNIGNKNYEDMTEEELKKKAEELGIKL